MKLINDFREFVNRGNVIDLAVGIVIGAAFTAIVNSLVNDLITPLIGVLSGGIDFSGLAITVGEESIMVGNFIQAVINFFIVAIAVFFLVRLINRFYRREEEKKAKAPAAPPADVELLTEIRNLLRAQLDVRRN